MGTTIFYFSGTGNSFKVAKDLASQLKDAKLVKINKDTLKGFPGDITEKVGIVFPVYYYGLPLIVKEFAENIKLNKGAYVFAVATCGGSAGASIAQLEGILERRRIKMSAVYRIVMPDNYQVLYAPPPEEKQKKLFKFQAEEVQRIGEDIEKCRIVGYNNKDNCLVKAFSGIIWGTFKPHNKDKNFWTDERCNGCGICSKICPAVNITMEENKPRWNHHCEHCLACMQWCPKESIQYRKGTLRRPRYHHPAIKVWEMFQD